MLIVKERIVKLNAGLSICPSGYLGSEDVGYCFRFKDDSPRQVSRQDAIQYCKQNGGKLLQLNLNEDQKLAIRLFAQLGLINTSGQYQKKSIKSFFLIFIEFISMNCVQLPTGRLSFNFVYVPLVNGVCLLKSILLFEEKAQLLKCAYVYILSN